MSKAQRVLSEMRKRKRVDTRKGRKRNVAKKTFKDLMRSTSSVRASQNPVGKVEFASVKAVPRNKQLIFKFETRAKTKGRAKYPQTIIFNKVQFSEEQTKDTPLRVSIPNGGFIFASKIKADENPVSVRCTCEDYYYMWWYHDNVNKAHAGPKMPPYVRKTPLPPARGAYPVRNPDEAPGLCKHLIACFKYLQSNKIMTR